MADDEGEDSGVDMVNDFLRRFDSFVTELSLIPPDKLKAVVGFIDERLEVIKNEIEALDERLEDGVEAADDDGGGYVIEETETTVITADEGAAGSEEILVTVHEATLHHHEQDLDLMEDHEYGGRPKRKRIPVNRDDYIVDSSVVKKQRAKEEEEARTVTVTDENGDTMKATIATDGSVKVEKVVGKENKVMNVPPSQGGGSPAKHKLVGRPMDCKLCPVKFEKRKEMQEHYKKQHPGASPWHWPCNICQVNFEKKKQLTDHYRTVHPTESRPQVHICDRCEKTFASNQGLQFHMETRHPAEPMNVLKCPEEDCTYQSYSRECLRSHRNSAHNQQRGPYKCPVCSKEYFGGQKKFREHMKLHTGELNYACEICGKRFVSANRLQYHIKNVHGEAKYRCDVCGKEFKAKVNFQRHQLVHTKDKPFKCHLCDFSCNTSGNLTVHVRGVHKVRGFTTGLQDKLKRKEILTKRFIKTGPAVVNQNGDEVPIDDVGDLPEVLGKMETTAYLDELATETNSKVSIEELKEDYKEPDLVRKPSKKIKKPRSKRKAVKEEAERVLGLEDYHQAGGGNELVIAGGGEAGEYFDNNDHQTVTLTNEKGEVIKAVISISGTVEVEAMDAMDQEEVVEEGVFEDGVVEHVVEECMELEDFSGEVVVGSGGDVVGEVVVANHNMPQQVVVEERTVSNPVRIQAVKRFKAADGTIIYQHF